MRKSLFLAVVLSLGLASFAHGGAVTHQLAWPQETIMLKGVIDDNDPIRNPITEFKRLLWDGGEEKDNYRIPAGKALVITDVDFAVFATELGKGPHGEAWLSIKNLSSGESNNAAAMEYWLDDRVPVAQKSYSMNTGIICRYGSKIEAVAHPEGIRFQHMRLRGYLVKVPKGQ